MIWVSAKGRYMLLHPAECLDLIPDAVVAHALLAERSVVLSDLLAGKEAKHTQTVVQRDDDCRTASLIT